MNGKSSSILTLVSLLLGAMAIYGIVTVVMLSDGMAPGRYGYLLGCYGAALVGAVLTFLRRREGLALFIVAWIAVVFEAWLLPMEGAAESVTFGWPDVIILLFAVGLLVTHWNAMSGFGRKGGGDA